MVILTNGLGNFLANWGVYLGFWFLLFVVIYLVVGWLKAGIDKIRNRD